MLEFKRGSAKNKPEPELQDTAKSRAIEYAWLCSSCCRDMSVYIDDEDRVKVARRTIPHLTEDEVPPIATIEQDPARVVEVGQIAGRGAWSVNERESWDLIFGKETHVAERELSSFVSAVTKLYGAEQARLSAQDWLDEFELVDGSSLSTERKWRAVTIAASARLAGRLNTTGNQQELLTSHRADTR